MPLPRPQDLSRLCEHWLRSGPDGESVAQRLRSTLRALEEVLDADGAAVVADSVGYVATGVLEGDGHAEQVEGPDDEVVQAGVLIRRRADDAERRCCVAVHFAGGEASDGRKAAVAAAAGTIGAWSRARVGEATGSFAGYTLLATLDEGGMGQLWLARPAAGGSPVALKRIWRHLAQDTGFVELFSREVQAALQVVHPAVVRILEYGVEAGQPYLVMEYLQGATLARLSIAARSADRVLSPELVVSLGLRYCEGLAAVHQHGLVHCDVSPQNLFVTFDGDAKVIDFGLARQRGTGQTDDREKPRGKVGYVAPEHLLHTAPDPRLDVYGLGVTLYELLSREPVQPVVKLYGEEELATLVARGVPEPVADVVLEAVQFDPTKRLASIDQLATRLRAAAETATLPRVGRERIAALMRDVLGDAEAQQKRLATGRLADATTSQGKTAALD